MGRICLVAGHGMGDPGACGCGLQEATEARRVVDAIAARIPGCYVYNKNQDLYQVQNYGVFQAGDEVWEIHFNAAAGAATGTEVLVKAGFSPDQYDNAALAALAKYFPNRGIKYRSDLANMNAFAGRGISYRLVEICFISNQNDVNTYQSKFDAIMTDLASAIKGSKVATPATPTPQPTPVPAPAKPATSAPNGAAPVDFFYAVKAGGMVYPEVKGLSDYAGVVGMGITDVAIRASAGTVKYRVHVLGQGWLPYVTGYNWADHENGYAGNGQVIDAIEVYYSTPTDVVAKYGYQKAKYRVSPIRQNFLPWQYDDEKDKGMDGYAGVFGMGIDRFQLY